METRDYYADLEVPKTATAEEIRQAYFRLAKVYHPDTESAKLDPDASAKFQRIKAAYDILSDPQKRKDYDNQAKTQPVRSLVNAATKGLSTLDNILKNDRVAFRANAIAKNLSLGADTLDSNASKFFGVSTNGIYTDRQNEKNNEDETKKKHKHAFIETDKGNLVCSCGKELTRRKK